VEGTPLLTVRLPLTSGRAPPAADHRNRRSGELQGSKLTGEVVHNVVEGHRRRQYAESSMATYVADACYL